MERVAPSAPGRLEVCGRWHGVRGRRFVRPTLTMTRASDGSEVRVLAELDEKPWAASDGEMWLATFATDVPPDEAAAMELNVAPDITVPLSGPGSTRRRRPAGQATGSAGGKELERLRAQTTAAAQGLERERERRRALEEALESERAQNRQVRMELGQVRAELELAQAFRVEGSESAAELDRVSHELYETRRQLDRARQERDRAAQAHTDTRTALHEQTGALNSAREALENLERERAGTSRHDHPAPNIRAGAGATTLYGRTSWAGRMLAVLVLAGVVVVVVLLIQGTVGH